MSLMTLKEEARYHVNSGEVQGMACTGYAVTIQSVFERVRKDVSGESLE